MLQWNPDDATACLEVAPWVADYETEYRYVVEQPGLHLTLTVWPLEAVVDVELRQPGLPQPLLQHFALYVADVLVYIHDQRGEYLEFRNCLLVPNRYYQQQPGGQHVKAIAATLGYRLLLFAKPQLRLQFAYPHQLT